MIPSKQNLILAGALTAVLAGLIALPFACNRNQVSRAEKAEKIAHEAKGRADVESARATEADGRALRLAASSQASAGRVAALEAELARVKSRYPQTPNPSSPVDIHVADIVLLSPLEVAQDSLIGAYRTEVADLKAENQILREARDGWKRAFEQERIRAQAQEAASQAYRSAMKSASWKAGFKGFAFGIAVGYLGAKR